MPKLPRTRQTCEATSAPQRAQPVAPTRAAEGAIVQRAMVAPRSLRPAELLAMQRTVGNRAVGRMLGRAPVQAKLTVNAPQDQYEREADRVAQDVLRAPTTPREETQGQQISPVIMPKPDAIKSGDGSFAAGEDFVQRLQARQGQGRPLPPTLREKFETKFGADFSGVRIHSGEQASQLSHDIHAQAFTHGSDIFLRASNYAPGTATGEHLLAHELTHVVQQGAAQPKMPPGVALASAPMPISPPISARPGGSARSMLGSKPAMIQRRIHQYNKEQGGWQLAEPGTIGAFRTSAINDPKENEYFNDVNGKRGQTINEVRAGLSDLMMITGSLSDEKINLTWPDTIWDALVESVPEKIQLDDLDAQLDQSRANLNINDASARARHKTLLERRDAASRQEALVKLGTVTLSPFLLPPPPAANISEVNLDEPRLPPPPPALNMKPLPALNMDPMAVFESDNTENISLLSALWNRFLLPFMKKNGQLPYIQRQEWFNNHGATVDIEVQFYWNRAASRALEFHKDTAGDNLFVNLIFNNKGDMPATEWIEDPLNPLPEKAEAMRQLMPQRMIQEITAAREAMKRGDHRPQGRGTIRGGIAGPAAFVSWVDDLVWHATPHVDSRVTVPSPKTYDRDQNRWVDNYDILRDAPNYWDKGYLLEVHRALYILAEASENTGRKTLISSFRPADPYQLLPGEWPTVWRFSTTDVDSYIKLIRTDRRQARLHLDDIKNNETYLRGAPISLAIGNELAGNIEGLPRMLNNATGIRPQTHRTNSFTRRGQTAEAAALRAAQLNTPRRSFIRTWVRVRKV